MAGKKDFRVKHGLRVSENLLVGTTTGGMSGTITVRDGTAGVPKIYIDDTNNNQTDYLIFARSDYGGSDTTKFYVRSDGSIYSEGNTQAIGGITIPSTQSLTISGNDGLNQCTTLAYPAGGTFEGDASNMVGAIRIELPVSWTSTMLRLEVDIYEYHTLNTCTTLVLGGYNYSLGSWVNEGGYTLNASTTAYYVAHFGHDGSHCNIFISKAGDGATSTWQYPQIRVKNVVLGYSGFNNSEWFEEWSVSLTNTITANDTVTLYPQSTYDSINSGYIPKASNNYGTVNQSVLYQDGTNIGVSTTIASFPLTIEGKGYSSTELQGGNAIIKTDTYSTSAVALFGSNATTQPIIFAINSDPSRYDAHITANGTFGVGPKYATSSYKMHISGGSSTSYNALRIDGGEGAESTDFITIRGSGANKALGINDYLGDLKITWWDNVNTDTNPRYAIGYADNYDQLEIVRNKSEVGGVCLLSINSAGHIGTNTFFPQHSLEINSLSGDQGVRFNSAGHRSWIRVSDRSGSFYFSAYNKKLLIGESNTVENSNAMFVLSTGFVGIKEPNPIHALTVNGNISASGTIFGATEATSVTSAELLNGYSDTQFLRSDINDYVDGKLFFNNVVGVGTDTPFEGFHFKGKNILMSGDFIKGARAIGFDWTTTNTWSATWYNHGIYSTEDPLHPTGGWGDDLSIASFHNVRVFLDSNNNKATSVFTIHDNSISAYDDSSVLFSVLGPDGKVGINTTSEGITETLTINGNTSGAGNAQFNKLSLNTTDTTYELNITGIASVSDDLIIGDAIIHDGDTNTYLQFHAADQWRVVTGGLERIEISNSGVIINEGGGSFDVRIEGDTDANLFITDGSADRVGIGSATPSEKLDVNGNIRTTGDLYLADQIIHDGDTNTYLQFHGADLFRIVTGGGERIEVSNTETVINDGSTDYDFRVESNTDAYAIFVNGGNDNVGIGTSNPLYKLEVNGTCHIVGDFTVGGTKSFLIDHPDPELSEDYYLQHVCLEGPEAAVYVRGTCDYNYIVLPKYWKHLVHEDSITVTLTPRYKPQNLYIESIDLEYNQINVGNFETGNVYDYVVYGVRKDVEKNNPIVNKQLISS